MATVLYFFPRRFKLEQGSTRISFKERMNRIKANLMDDIFTLLIDALKYRIKIANVFDVLIQVLFPLFWTFYQFRFLKLNCHNLAEVKSTLLVL